MSVQTLSTEIVSVAHQQTYPDSVFPQVTVNRSVNASLSETSEWIRENRDSLDAKARQCGAILFRGFPVRTAEDFDAFVAAFGFENFAYKESLSNAVRVNRTERVFTANEAPPSVTIYLHHEMAQTPVYPSRLLFFCEQAAETGGATPLCRSDILWNRLEKECPEFARQCEAKGLRYTNVMPDADDPQSGMGRSWRSTFHATDAAAAEARMSKLGYQWQWLDQDCLKATTPVLPAVRQLPDGRKVFFNQLIAAFKGWSDQRNDPTKAITFGDGTPMDAQGVMTAADIGEELSFDVPWQTGDVALVDNYVAMHGRRTFTGTRKVLASLVAKQSNEF